MKREIGIKGEEQAVQHLLALHYFILARNFRSRFGEIDIIAYDKINLTTVFVEVRVKTSLSFGKAEESLTYTKKQRLLKTAQYYLSNHPTENIRFDFIAINLFEEVPLKHYQNIIAG